MLILTRRAGQSIMIGDDIRVTVLAVNTYQVRLGVTAPKDVAVHRDEIYEKIRNGVPHEVKPVQVPRPAWGRS